MNEKYEEMVPVDSLDQMKDSLEDLVRAMRDKIIERIKADGKEPTNYLLTVYDEHLSGRIRMEATIHEHLR